jgi:hypothetical protein
MLFQVIVIFAFGCSLLGVFLFRKYVQKLVAVVAIVAGFVATEIDHYKAGKELWAAQHEIRTLGLQFSAKFSADWKDGRVPNTRKWINFGTGTRVGTAEFILRDGKSMIVEFHGAENMKFTPTEGDTTTVSYFTSALPGAAIYTLQPDAIDRIQQFIFELMFSSDMLKHPFITIHQVNAMFYVNGQRSFSVEDTIERWRYYGVEGKNESSPSWPISYFGKVAQLQSAEPRGFLYGFELTPPRSLARRAVGADDIPGPWDQPVRWGTTAEIGPYF